MKRAGRWKVIGAVTATAALAVMAPVVFDLVDDHGEEPDRNGHPELSDDLGVVLNVGEWQIGDPTRHMRVGGTLATSPDGCVVLRSGDGEDFNIVWPAGWYVRASGDGWGVTSPDGAFTATAGERLEGSGGEFSGELQCRLSPAALTLAFDGPPVIDPG